MGALKPSKQQLIHPKTREQSSRDIQGGGGPSTKSKATLKPYASLPLPRFPAVSLAVIGKVVKAALPVPEIVSNSEVSAMSPKQLQVSH